MRVYDILSISYFIMRRKLISSDSFMCLHIIYNSYIVVNNKHISRGSEINNKTNYSINRAYDGCLSRSARILINWYVDIHCYLFFKGLFFISNAFYTWNMQVIWVKRVLLVKQCAIWPSVLHVWSTDLKIDL